MKTNSAAYRLTSCALMAALMCVLCPMSIPIGPIPISLSILIILLTVCILGTKSAFISYTVYLLLGAAGMPVFSGFQGGLAKLTGPTGGYLIGFLPMILIAGFFIKKSNGKLPVTIAGMILGTLVAYLFGTVWFVLQTQSAISYALSVCVIPFIPFDLLKLALASVFGKILRDALAKANLLPA